MAVTDQKIYKCLILVTLNDFYSVIITKHKKLIMCGASAVENSARNARNITSAVENILYDISND